MFGRKILAVAATAFALLAVPATAAFAGTTPSWHPSQGGQQNNNMCPQQGGQQQGPLTQQDNRCKCTPEPWGSWGQQQGSWGPQQQDSCTPPPRRCIPQTVTIWDSWRGQLTTDAMLTWGEHLKLDGMTYTVTSLHSGHPLTSLTLSPHLSWWDRGKVLDFTTGNCARV